MPPQLTGVVFNIQKYSLHDGPGTRTLVFLKGCPLRCQWCANPESHKPAIQQVNGKSFGQRMSVQEVVDIVLQDQMFYQSSGGGLTLSGGEPTAQPAFAEAILHECKQQGIHCALETCGYAPWSTFQKLIPYVDIFLYDIKHLSSSTHASLTGVDNSLILANLHQLLQIGAQLRLRMPLIPDCTDQDNLEQTLDFVHSLQQNYSNLSGLDILPYHEYGLHKYAQLAMEYPLPHIQALSPADLEKIEERKIKNVRVLKH